MAELTFCTDLLQDIKRRIAEAQTRAILSVNAELIRLYWDIGQLIDQRQQEEGWGTGFIPKLSTDIRNEIPEIKGFSQRNISYMLQFAREYGDPSTCHHEVMTEQETQAQQIESGCLILQQLVAKIPWGHNILHLEAQTSLSNS